MKTGGETTAGARWRGLAATPLAAVLLVALNLLLDALPASWGLDVTAERRHTLTEATKRTLAGIPEPITVRLYISPALRDSRGTRGDHAERVESLLRRYTRLAGGGLRLKVLRPAPFSETEDQALADGLRPLRLAGGQTGYFGLAGVNSTDDREVIPAFDPARAGLLEADLTRLIHGLAHPRKPRVGLLGRLDLTAPGRGAPNRLRQVLAQRFAVTPVPRDAQALPADLDALLLAQPTGLSPELRRAVAGFVRAGGPVLAFVDPLSERLAYRPEPAPGARLDSAVSELLAEWGARLAEGRFVGDRRHAMTVRARVGGRDGDVDYVGWLGLPGEALSDSHGATAGLSRLVLKSAGALTPRAGAEAAFTPLVTSSPDAALFPVARIAGGPGPARLLADFPSASATGRRVLAAELRPGKGSGRVILVADSDLLHDAAWLRAAGDDSGGDPVPIADNGSFALGALEGLTGGAALAGLRGGAPPSRPFTRIERLRERAEQRYRSREAELIDAVGGARRELRTLRERQAERGTAPTAEEAARMAALQDTLRAARRDLRAVQRRLHADVARIQRAARLANVWGVPALIAGALIGLYLLRRWTRRRRAQRWQARAETEAAP